MFTIKVTIGEKEKVYKTENRKLARTVAEACNFLGIPCTVETTPKPRQVKFRNL